MASAAVRVASVVPDVAGGPRMTRRAQARPGARSRGRLDARDECVGLVAGAAFQLLFTVPAVLVRLGMATDAVLRNGTRLPGGAGMRLVARHTRSERSVSDRMIGVRRLVTSHARVVRPLLHVVLVVAVRADAVRRRDCGGQGTMPLVAVRARTGRRGAQIVTAVARSTGLVSPGKHGGLGDFRFLGRVTRRARLTRLVGGSVRRVAVEALVVHDAVGRRTSSVVELHLLVAVETAHRLECLFPMRTVAIEARLIRVHDDRSVGFLRLFVATQTLRGFVEEPGRRAAASELGHGELGFGRKFVASGARSGRFFTAVMHGQLLVAFATDVGGG